MIAARQGLHEADDTDMVAMRQQVPVQPQPGQA